MARAVVPGARHWPLAALVVASALWGGAIAGTKYALILGEAISRAAAVAIALGLGGLVVMTSGGGHSTAAGDLCVAGGVLSASLYSVVAKRFASDGDGDALSLTTWQFTAATTVAAQPDGVPNHDAQNLPAAGRGTYKRHSRRAYRTFRCASSAGGSGLLGRLQ
jgi:drug/metabolite transporter (DMT)-like permease